MGPSAHRPAAPGAAWHDRPAALGAAPPKHDVRPLSAQPVFFGSGGFQPVFRERWLSASFSGAEAFSHWLQFCKNGFDRWSHLGSDSSEGGMNDRDSSGDSLPGLTDSSGDSLPPRDSDDASSVESSADSLGATVALATFYMSVFQLEALVRLAFIRWRLLAIFQGQREGRQARGRATR